MSTAETEAAAPPSIFPPYREARIPWTLLGFIALSLTGHALTFLFFQVVYPQHVTIPATGPQVALLTASSQENEAILRWVAAEDPALASAGAAAVPPALFEIPYRPSFAKLRTPPRSMPETATRPEPPPSPLTLPLLPTPSSSASSFPSSSKRARTHPTFTPPLTNRPFSSPAPLRLPPNTPLEPASFLIAVTEQGEIPYLFLQRTSGDKAADQAAANYLTAGRFTEEEGAGTTWAEAIINWGADIPAAAP